MPQSNFCGIESTNKLSETDSFVLQKITMDENNHLPPPDTNKKINKFVYVLTFFSAIGGFLFGYDTGVISGVMIILKKQFMLNNLWQELIVSVTVGCAAVFALLGGFLNSWWGRRGVIICASIVFLAGSILLGLSNSKEMLLAGRAIVGVGIGLSSMTVPMYIAEVSPSNIRGRLVTINNLFITGGQFVASCIDGIFSQDKVNGWRYMLGLAAIPAFIQFIGFLFLPESPRWLMQKEKYDKAIISLRKVLGDEHLAHKEFQVVKKVVEDERRIEGSNSTIIRALSHVGVRRALIIGCGLQMFQQLSGINTVMYYSATIVQMSGVRNDTVAIWLAAATAFVNFVFTFVGVWLVERMGRRLLSLISIVGVTGSLLFLSAGFYLSSVHSPPVTINSTTLGHNSTCFSYKSCSGCIQSINCGYCYDDEKINTSCLPVNASNMQDSEFGSCKSDNSDGFYFASNYCPTQYSWMALLGMILYLAFFAPGMGPMPWTINSEIYPQWARSTGNAFSTTTNWVFNVIVSLTFLDITQQLTTQGAFLLYALLAFAGFLFIFLLLPETKGKPLEEVESLFHEGYCLVCCRKEREAYDRIINEPQSAEDDNDEHTLFIKS